MDGMYVERHMHRSWKGLRLFGSLLAYAPSSFKSSCTPYRGQITYPSSLCNSCRCLSLLSLFTLNCGRSLDFSKAQDEACMSVQELPAFFVRNGLLPEDVERCLDLVRTLFRGCVFDQGVCKSDRWADFKSALLVFQRIQVSDGVDRPRQPQGMNYLSKSARVLILRILE